MLTYLRYADGAMHNGVRNTLVILSVAVCSLCILLILTSIGHRHKVFVTIPLIGRVYGDVEQGFAHIEVSPLALASPGPMAGMASENLRGQPGRLYYTRQLRGFFGGGRRSVYFPLWYVILAFGLLAAFTHRFDGRFTLRSAIIATTVLAGLLGMAVGM